MANEKLRFGNPTPTDVRHDNGVSVMKINGAEFAPGTGNGAQVVMESQPDLVSVNAYMRRPPQPRIEGGK